MCLLKVLHEKASPPTVFPMVWTKPEVYGPKQPIPGNPQSDPRKLSYDVRAAAPTNYGRTIMADASDASDTRKPLRTPDAPDFACNGRC
jgi:hypothetical protein